MHRWPVCSSAETATHQDGRQRHNQAARFVYVGGAMTADPEMFPSKSTAASALRRHVFENIVPNSTIDPTPSCLERSGCLKRRWRRLCCTHVPHERCVPSTSTVCALPITSFGYKWLDSAGKIERATRLCRTEMCALEDQLQTRPDDHMQASALVRGGFCPTGRKMSPKAHPVRTISRTRVQGR